MTHHFGNLATTEFCFARSSAERWLRHDITVGEIAWDLLNHADFCVQLRAEDLLEYMEPMLEAVLDLSCVKRLLGVHQLSEKRDPRTWEHQPIMRLHHVKVVAAMAVVACARMNVRRDDAVNIVIGAHLHDIGHYTVSHPVDDLVRELGGLDHEARAIQMINDRPEMRQFFAAFASCGLRSDRVKEVILERRHYYGALMGIIDTLGYLVLDGGLMGIEELTPAFAHSVIGEMVKIHFNQIVLRDTAPLARMLYFRSYLYKYLYYYNQWCLLDRALVEVVRYYIRGGILTVQNLGEWTDDELKRKLASFNPSRVSSIAGYWDLLNRKSAGERWELSRYSDEFSARLALREAREGGSALICPPLYREKKVTAILPDGRERIVTSDYDSEVPRDWRVWRYKSCAQLFVP